MDIIPHRQAILLSEPVRLRSGQALDAHDCNRRDVLAKRLYDYDGLSVFLNAKRPFEHPR